MPATSPADGGARVQPDMAPEVELPMLTWAPSSVAACAGPPKTVMDFSVARPRKSTRRAAAGFDMRRLQQISDGGGGQPPAPPAAVVDGGGMPPAPLAVVDGRDTPLDEVPQEEALETLAAAMSAHDAMDFGPNGSTFAL
mmetsp:Transcript_33646/g.70580  ORF Transcript_33646/g.70580 Transcript_33646/m.70580 type:complete len:140 (+) Transcript_33646:813-1232(+)